MCLTISCGVIHTQSEPCALLCFHLYNAALQIILTILPPQAHHNKIANDQFIAWILQECKTALTKSLYVISASFGHFDFKSCWYGLTQNSYTGGQIMHATLWHGIMDPKIFKFKSTRTNRFNCNRDSHGGAELCNIDATFNKDNPQHTATAQPSQRWRSDLLICDQYRLDNPLLRICSMQPLWPHICYQLQTEYTYW